MHEKFNDDICDHFLVIMKNVIISFIKEYRGPTFRPLCDVIGHHHEKYFLWHNLGWSFHIWGQIEAVLNISKFSKWPPFSGRRKLFYRMFYRKLNIPWIYQQDSYAYFWYFEPLIDVLAQILTEINFKIRPTLWPGDVIDDVTSAWNITGTTRHPQQCACKILFV